jgi:ribosome modulation factor
VALRMLNMRRRRRNQVAAVRQEGYEAGKAGKSIQTVPQAYLGTMDRYQWERGWRDGTGKSA